MRTYVIRDIVQDELGLGLLVFISTKRDGKDRIVRAIVDTA
jgi:hypothetical protein